MVITDNMGKIAVYTNYEKSKLQADNTEKKNQNCFGS